MKEQFFIGWEVVLDGKEHCQSFLESQIVEKEVALNIGTYIHLVYGHNDILEKATMIIDHIEDDVPWRQEWMQKGIGKLERIALTPNNIYEIKYDFQGKNHLGGKAPEGFSFPQNLFKNSFQYLGKISCSDKHYNWLPFDLHLVYPVYYCIKDLMLDYSDPLHPKVLNIEELIYVEPEFESFTSEAYVEYHQRNFSLKKIDHEDCIVGNAGVPFWMQYSNVPRCPKTKKTMKFICQIDQNASFPIKKKNFPILENETRYFEDGEIPGYIYIFFEPDSKTCSIITQNC